MKTNKDAQPESAGERVVRPQFIGSASEYFRIWIVNLFFTLLTLGIYSPWAKVRKKRYFYGSTRLDGDSFDYFASPKAILYGRIIAVAAFVLYAFVGEIYPPARYAFLGIALVVLPWLVVRAFAFNARNSAWRGLRFDFSASQKDTLKLYLKLLAVMILTAGLGTPWVLARYRAFVVSHHAYGATGFGCDLQARAFFGIYLRAFLMTVVLMAPLVGVMAYAMKNIDMSGPYAWIAFAIPPVWFYTAYALTYAYTQARATNLQWNNAYGPGLRFSSTLGARKLAGLYLGNIVAVALTAGLLIPWAVIRTLRYRLENFAMIIEDEVVHEANPQLPPVGAAGQELGDIFNLDLAI